MKTTSDVQRVSTVPSTMRDGAVPSGLPNPIDSRSTFSSGYAVCETDGELLFPVARHLAGHREHGRGHVHADRTRLGPRRVERGAALGARGLDERAEPRRTRRRTADLDDRERHHVRARSEEPRHLLDRIVLATYGIARVAEAIGAERDDLVEVAGGEHAGRRETAEVARVLADFSGLAHVLTDELQRSDPR